MSLWHKSEEPPAVQHSHLAVTLGVARVMLVTCERCELAELEKQFAYRELL